MNKIIEAAKTAQKSWAKTPLWKRAELLHKAAAILKEHRAPIAECLVKEIAKPAKDAVTEVWRTKTCWNLLPDYLYWDFISCLNAKLNACLVIFRSNLIVYNTYANCTHYCFSKSKCDEGVCFASLSFWGVIYVVWFWYRWWGQGIWCHTVLKKGSGFLEKGNFWCLIAFLGMKGPNTASLQR